MTDEQMERLRPFLPKSRGRPWVDDRRVLSGIIFVDRIGLRWRDTLRDCGPTKALHNRWRHWTKRVPSSGYGGLNTKLHGVANANGRPFSVFLIAWPVSDCTDAVALLDDPPKAEWLLDEHGYDADWLRDTLQAKRIRPCIPRR